MNETHLLSLVPNWPGRKNIPRCRVLAAYFDRGPLLELFGGSGKLSLMHGHGRWNDVNVCLYTLACAIKADPGGLAQDCLHLYNHPETLPADWKKRANVMVTEASLAPHEFAYLLSITFGGRLNGRLHPSRRHCSAFKAWVQRLPQVAARLQGIDLSNDDWRDAMAVMPTDWQVYADPPYTTRSPQYRDASAAVDMAALAAQCQTLRRAVVNDGLQHSLPDGWHHVFHGPQKSQLGNRLVRGTIARGDWDALWQPYQAQLACQT